MRAPVLPNPAWRYRLGDVVHDLSCRTLVMGIVAGAPDPTSDRDGRGAFDRLLRQAEGLVQAGADVLDVGEVEVGGDPEAGAASEAEEVDRVIPAIEALRARFDAAISCDTWRASVLDAACSAGAVVGHDLSGFADPDYLVVAAKHRASVVATHVRRVPREPDPGSHAVDPVADVDVFLRTSAARAEAAGLGPEQICVDAGLDLGTTPVTSAVLLRESAVLARHGYVLMLSARTERRIGDPLHLDPDDCRAASLASVAYGVMQGCRIVRAQDVAGSVRVCRMVEAILARRAERADDAEADVGALA